MFEENYRSVGQDRVVWLYATVHIAIYPQNIRVELPGAGSFTGNFPCYELVANHDQDPASLTVSHNSPEAEPSVYRPTPRPRSRLGR